MSQDKDFTPLRRPNNFSGNSRTAELTQRPSSKGSTQYPPTHDPPRKFFRNVRPEPLYKDHWHIRRDIPGSDVSPLRTINPIENLEYCLDDLREFIPTVSGLLPNLNWVANNIYRIGANRPRADTWCEFGHAKKPKVLPPKYVSVQEVKKLLDESTATPCYAGEPRLERSVCLPTLGQRKSLSPAKQTLWSKGKSPGRMDYAYAWRGKIP